MKKYCFDTSGLSKPLEDMPADIHETMWDRVTKILKNGELAVTVEIYDEMCHIDGDLGSVIRSHKKAMALDVGDSSWNWNAYKTCAAQIQTDHHDFISEYCGGSPKTACLNDISIIALAKALSLPVVSSEQPVKQSPNKRKIPDICKLEGVQHLTFNDFLRAEKIRS